MIALRQAQRAGLLQPDQWLPNIVAGVVVGVVALPLSMAFAIASGAKPEQGVYTAIIAGLLVSSLGGSLVQIAGPTGAFVVVLAGITAKHGIGGMQLASVLWVSAPDPMTLMKSIMPVSDMAAAISFAVS